MCLRTIFGLERVLWVCSRNWLAFLSGLSISSRFYFSVFGLRNALNFPFFPLNFTEKVILSTARKLHLKLDDWWCYMIEKHFQPKTALYFVILTVSVFPLLLCSTEVWHEDEHTRSINNSSTFPPRKKWHAVLAPKKALKFVFTGCKVDGCRGAKTASYIFQCDCNG